MLPGGECLDRRSIPQVSGGDEKEKEERPRRRGETAKSLEVELDLSGRFPGKYARIGLRRGKRGALYFG